MLDDPTYKRKGDDLYVDLPVSMFDLCWAATCKSRPWRGQVAMTIPEGTQNNRLLRLTGKGMPKVKGSGSGDQFVRLIGQLPTKITDKQRKLFTEWQS